jgi:hypothetical protein
MTDTRGGYGSHPADASVCVRRAATTMMTPITTAQ